MANTKQITPKSDVAKLGTILSIWAHPDDETFTCGGLMAAAVKNGQRVVCVTATKGEKGSKYAPPEQVKRLGEVRATELHNSLAVLGVNEHHWLNYQDGQCQTADPKAAIEQLTNIIQSVKPDTILTFGPDGVTGHTDHATVSRWVALAVRQTGGPTNVYHAVVPQDAYDECLKAADQKFNIYFNTSRPPLKNPLACDICFRLDNAGQLLKRQALEAMPSQTGALLQYFDDQKFTAAFACECFVKA